MRLPTNTVEKVYLGAFSNLVYAYTDDGDVYVAERQWLPGTCSLGIDDDTEWKRCTPSRIPKTITYLMSKLEGSPA